MRRFADRAARGPASSRTRAALAACAALLVSGCGGATAFEVGARPRVERLESGLELGRSTAEDVLRVLGAPSGTGRSQLPTESEPRPMWAYQYERTPIAGAEPGSLERSYLFVYFRDGRYDGYLWFSSVAPRGGGS